MNTVETTKTGLPSFEPEWPLNAEGAQESALAAAVWVYDSLRQKAQNASWEDAWRGIREYDSPLAG
jgi:hypothetical protein